MVHHFWNTLYHRVTSGGAPITALAPMADVTDRVYRGLVAKYSGHGESGVDILWTEFVSCDGLCSRGQQHLLFDLQYSETERPLIAQIFGSNPETFHQAAELIAGLGFDGIDINMGCPDQTINKQGAGACLIQTPQLAVECINAAKRGAAGLPVSVKTRIGWSRDESDTWIPALLDAGIDALSIHARTRREMSDYPPHWDVMQRIVELSQPYQIPVLANGGIMSVSEGNTVCAETGAHGYMVGKATFGNPWFFRRGSAEVIDAPVTPLEKLTVAREHTVLYAQYVHTGVGPEDPDGMVPTAAEFVFGGLRMPATESVRGKSMNLMKKNFRCYINGWHGAKELRIRLMDAETSQDIIAILDQEIDSLIKA